MEARMTSAMMIFLKICSGRILIILMPINPPRIIKGSAIIFNINPDQVRVCHTKACNGTLLRLSTNINQADVAAKVILSRRLESIKTDNAGPAAFHIIVEKPKIKPNKGEYQLLLVSFSLVSGDAFSIQSIIATPTIIQIPILILKVLSSM